MFGLQLVIGIFMTSKAYPYLGRYDSEKYFYSPEKGEKCKFPSIHDPPSTDLSVIVPAYFEEERCKLLKCCFYMQQCPDLEKIGYS